MGACCSADEHARLARVTVTEDGPPRHGQTVPFRLMRVIDGDTIVGAYLVDPSVDVPLVVSVRLAGLDTPERNTEAGQRVRAAVVRRFEGRHGPVTIQVIKWDKWGGRIDARVFLGSECLNDWLLARRWAKPFNGHTKKPEWTRQELERIVADIPPL